MTSAVSRKAEIDVALAQVDTIPHRHPWEVVLDATHLQDVAVREELTRLVKQLAAGEEVTQDRIDRLTSMNQLRHQLASTAISTKAHEKVSLAFTQHLEVQGQLVGLAIDAVVRGLTTSLDTASGDQLHDWALAQAHRMLVAAQDGEPAEPPEVEPPPFALAVITGAGAGTAARPATIDAPALGAAVPDGAVPDDLTGLDDATIKRLAELLMVEAERRDL